jgi:hypothetical protein
MKKRAALFLAMLLVSLPGYATTTNAHRYANFSKPSGKAKLSGTKSGVPVRPDLSPAFGRGTPQAGLRRLARPRTFANPAPTTIGYVSATQIPTGGGAYFNGVTGDFNGDGKKDVATIVQIGPCCSPSFSLSVELGNGDGTFQTPKLTSGLNATALYQNGAQLFTADLNSDGKQDVVVGYQSDPYSSMSGSFDVFLGNGDGTFNFSANYPITTNYLSNATIADVNGDGKLDVVVVDQGSPSSVWTFFGAGDGTFGAATSVALSGTIYNGVISDLNGDGSLDIAGDDTNSYELTVYLASGNGYASGVPYNTSDGATNGCFNTAGDLNGDGKPEIVAANCGDNSLTVYVNNGDGTFQTGAYYASGAYPEAVTVADINGDGAADLISTNDDSSDITVLSGNGDGTVNPPSVGYATGGYPFNPALVADFNGDGAADVIVPDDAFSLAFLAGYGDGTFHAAVDYYTPGVTGYEYGIQIATGDFNGDGNTDFVISNSYQNGVGVTVFLSRGDGSLQPGVNYPGVTGTPLEFVTAADLNGDGILDLAATNYIDGTVQIFTGVGDGTFLTGNTYPTNASGSNTFGIAAGDFNGDGSPDLAVVNINWSSQTQDVGVLLNDTTGDFSNLTNYPLSAQAYEITAADLNGDGFPELIVPLYNGSSGVATFAGSNNGTFGNEVDISLANGLTTYNNPYAATVGDLNGDGKPDLAITIEDYTNLAQGIAVAYGNGDGTFQAPILVPTTVQASAVTNNYYPYPSYVKFLDLNGDGKLDMVYTDSNYSTVGIVYNQGGGAFYDPVEYPAGGYAYGLALADVNSDGAVDAVAAGDDFAGVTVLLNNSGSGAAVNYTLSANPATATVAAGSSATFNISVVPTNGYNGTITFSCGTLPAGATCSFSPSMVTPTANQTAQVVLTVHTSAAKAFVASAQPHPGSGVPTLWASLSGMGLFGLLFTGDFRKRNSRGKAIVLGLVLLVMVLSLVGCGGGSSTSSSGGGGISTPPGTYSLQVNATGTAGSFGGNTSVHSLNLSVTVQ